MLTPTDRHQLAAKLLQVADNNPDNAVRPRNRENAIYDFLRDVLEPIMKGATHDN